MVKMRNNCIFFSRCSIVQNPLWLWRSQRSRYSQYIYTLKKASCIFVLDAIEPQFFEGIVPYGKTSICFVFKYMKFTPMNCSTWLCRHQHCVPKPCTIHSLPHQKWPPFQHPVTGIMKRIQLLKKVSHSKALGTNVPDNPILCNTGCSSRNCIEPWLSYSGFMKCDFFQGLSWHYHQCEALTVCCKNTCE